MYQERNPGIRYEYSIPKGVSQQVDPDSYSWIYDEYTQCSAPCGGGKKNIKTVGWGSWGLDMVVGVVGD